ncbi:hypothetical protein DAPPUDRAFT_319530 [Daphnia pulex]|uniref:Uncharacterized protein n=1 Tax=Daphnia pulex TaxID=6669 RepID=E9GM10_DAPPU|nr:hypothetical protein DAPPUDRAFT_319530 [Daphnia pulex]|eukprot:EFX79283.1 hypothetical protein DAPPUDRAFT_319530 [Daphnia pulex]
MKEFERAFGKNTIQSQPRNPGRWLPQYSLTKTGKTTANLIWNFATLTVVNVEKEEKPEPKVEPEEPLTTGITSANGTNFTFFKTGYCGVSLLTYD